MSTESPPIFTEESFLSKLVPFFEERKAQLSTLLANDAQWMAFFSKLHLVYIDNHKSARDSWLYISNIVDDNRYFADTEPARPEEVLFGGSSERFPEAQAVYITVLQQLCFAFLEELLSRATPEQIASFIQQYLQSIYRTVEKRVKPDYIWFQVPNIKFRSVGLFALTASMVDIVIPLVNTLDSAQIPDELPDSEKVLITQRRDVSGYTNFHEVLGPGNLASDLALSAFLSGIPLYRQVLGKGNEEAFKIVELLQTLTDMRIFQAQQQLVALPFSNGPAFEAYLRTFLTLCFEPHYENLSIREQVPNRGRLRIRDFIIVNNESSSPFLRSLKTKGADFLLFDAKNYAEPLTTREIDTFRQYLHNNPSFGNFGVILSRKGASEHCQESIFRELPTIKIVVLNEDDLLLMLEHAGTGRSAVAILEEKYNELMLQL